MNQTNFGGGCFYGRQTPTDYETNKENARTKAQEWQNEAAGTCLSCQELSEAGAKFAKLGKRFGLLKEFRENGII